MATIAGIDLQLDDPRFSSGAAFLLSQAARDDATVTLAQSSASLYRGGEFITVHLPVLLPVDKLFSQAHEAAQCALDVVSVTSVGDGLAIPNGHREHFLWWRRGKGTTLRFTSHADLTFSASVTATVIRADGTVEPTLVPVVPSWHPAFRYFRLSQTTDDLYDSYRNMYLAFESVLSVAAPKMAREPEGVWLHRALNILQGSMSLAPYVTPGVADPVKAFLKEQYKAHRCALFHAKTSRSPLLPGSYRERSQVGVALGRLARLVNDMMRLQLSTQRGSAVLTAYAFRTIIEGMHNQGLTLAVTDDDTPAQRDQTSISPAGHSTTDLQTRYEGIIDDMGCEHAFLGQIGVDQLPSKAICCIASHTTESVVTRGTFSRVVLDGVDTLEAVLVFAMSNRGELRSRFPL